MLNWITKLLGLENKLIHPVIYEMPRRNRTITAFSTFYFCQDRMKHSHLQGSSSPHSHPSSFIFPPQIQNLRSRIKWFYEKRWSWQEGILSIKEQVHGHVNIQDKMLSATRQAVQGLLGRAELGSEGLIIDARWSIQWWGGLCCCSSQANIEA